MAKIVDPFAELWHPHRINSQIRCDEIELPMLKKEINYYIFWMLSRNVHKAKFR